MKATLLISIVLAVVIKTTICETTNEQAQFFGTMLNGASQLVHEQEMQRKMADIFVGLHQANSFRSMANAKYQAGVLRKQRGYHAIQSSSAATQDVFQPETVVVQQAYIPPPIHADINIAQDGVMTQQQQQEILAVQQQQEILAVQQQETIAAAQQEIAVQQQEIEVQKQEIEVQKQEIAMKEQEISQIAQSGTPVDPVVAQELVAAQQETIAAETALKRAEEAALIDQNEAAAKIEQLSKEVEVAQLAAQADAIASNSQQQESTVMAAVEHQNAAENSNVGEVEDNLSSDKDIVVEDEEKPRSLESRRPTFRKHHKLESELDYELIDLLEQSASASKITALKYFGHQLVTTASDVSQSYWLNRYMAASVPPQLSMFKVYKNYLNTIGLSYAFELQDIFSFEAYTDHYNRRFFPEATNKGSLVVETVAEHTVYQKWQSLAMIRYYLFIISIYEQSMASQASQPTAVPTQAAANPSLLEVESETKQVQDPSAMMYYQYVSMSYMKYMMKYYAMILEISVSNYGLMITSQKLQGLHMLRDDTTSNDEQGHSLVSQSLEMEAIHLSGLISQWSSIVSMRYYVEYYMFLMFDMQLPQLAPARAYERVDAGMMSPNFLQTAKQ